MHGWGVMRTGILLVMGERKRTNNLEVKYNIDHYICPSMVVGTPMRVPSRVGACFFAFSCMRAHVKSEHVLVC
jgi:hypothetical protein